MSIERMHPDDLAALKTSVSGCKCPFTEAETHALILFASTLNGDGFANWTEVLALGGGIRQAKKVGTATLVATLLGGLLLALWVGIKHLAAEGAT